MKVNKYALRDQLRRDEGMVLHAYQDHLGYWTIGVGRLIDPVKHGGISEDEALMLLDADIARVRVGVHNALPWIDMLDPVRQGVLHNMAFQLGVAGLRGFRRTLDLVRCERWQEAGRAMLQSKWARQTPERAQRLARQMVTGEWQ